MTFTTMYIQKDSYHGSLEDSYQASCYLDANLHIARLAWPGILSRSHVLVCIVIITLNLCKKMRISHSDMELPVYLSAWSCDKVGCLKIIVNDSGKVCHKARHIYHGYTTFICQEQMVRTNQFGNVIPWGEILHCNCQTWFWRLCISEACSSMFKSNRSIVLQLDMYQQHQPLVRYPTTYADSEQWVRRVPLYMLEQMSVYWWNVSGWLRTRTLMFR